MFVDSAVLEQAKAAESSSSEPDQEKLQKWLESLDPDDLGYKM